MTPRTRRLQAWMKLNGIEAKDIAETARVSKTAVYKYVRGEMSSTKLRAWFRAKGCPSSNLPTIPKKRTTTMGKAA